MKYYSFLLLAFLTMFAGCSSTQGVTDTISDTWDTTMDYVDPPPTIDTDRYTLENPNQVKLAQLFTPVDGPLTSLSRFIENTDTLPGVDWLDLLLARYPWVNTVMVTDEDGNIIFMQPENPIKKLSEPLKFEGVWRQSRLLTRVDYTELGPEFYIGRPYFKDVNFRGLIGVGFDPRTLLTLSPAPTELIIIHPGGGVISRGPVDKEAIMSVNWEEILADDVHGEVEVGDKHYTWIVRYIGKDPYIYATKSVEPNADSGWLF